jgi:glycosyltransferase involved in cell wall biosynthesis
MLSICIPIYNFDVQNLVRGLHQQASALQQPFEIICLDDGSETRYKSVNKELDRLSNVHYRELPENIGRSRIRNLLAQESSHPWLLFMDCDFELIQDDFLKQYIDRCAEKRVVVGSRLYPEARPSSPSLLLRWLYGKNREEQPSDIRNQHPYHAFCTAHFLCPRSVFQSIQFEEQLSQYGHEDTLFGQELARHGYEVLHIDAALRHLELEEAPVFLRKTRQSIENLAFLSQRYPFIETRLLQIYRRLYKWKLHYFLPFAYRYFRAGIERQLCSATPRLRLFDLYKLSYLAIRLKKSDFRQS